MSKKSSTRNLRQKPALLSPTVPPPVLAAHENHGGILWAHCDHCVLTVSGHITSAGQSETGRRVSRGARRSMQKSQLGIQFYWLPRPQFPRSNRETLLRVAQDGRGGYTHTKHKSYRVLAINSSNSRCVLRRNSFRN